MWILLLHVNVMTVQEICIFVYVEERETTWLNKQLFQPLELDRSHQIWWNLSKGWNNCCLLNRVVSLSSIIGSNYLSCRALTLGTCHNYHWLFVCVDIYDRTNAQIFETWDLSFITYLSSRATTHINIWFTQGISDKIFLEMKF